MAGIALHGHKFNNVSNPSNHITCTTRWWDSCYSTDSEGDCEGGWDYDYGVNVLSTATGTVKGNTTTVFINTKTVARQSGRTNETDIYTLPSDYYSSLSGNHSNTEGTITGGNSKNVYAQGQLIAVNGGVVVSHANKVTTIIEGSTNVFIAG